jgi:uncharacterized protein YndB with AHSA1/START domain
MTTPSKVGKSTFTNPSDTELVMTRLFDAPRTRVFDAWTNPKHLPHWMIGPEGWTMPVCEVDLRPGGAWHFVWRRADGTEMSMRGVYTEVTPPERLVSTESWGGPFPDTINTLVLTEENGKTIATLTITYPSKAARDAAAATGMRQGMEASNVRLERYLQSLT